MDGIEGQIGAREHGTGKTKYSWDDLRSTKRHKINSQIQEFQLIGDVVSQIFCHLSLYDAAPLALVSKTFYMVFVKDFTSRDYYQPIKNFQVLLKIISSAILLQSTNNLDQKYLQKIKYDLILPKIDALYNWVLKEKTRLNKNEQMLHEIFLILDGDYDSDLREIFARVNKSLFDELAPEKLHNLLIEMHKIREKRSSNYNFLLIHISNNSASEPVSNYSKYLKIRLSLTYENIGEANKGSPYEVVKKNLFLAKYSLISLLVSLEDKDCDVLENQVLLPKDFENLFFLVRKEKEIRGHIFHFLGGKIEDHSPEACFSHFFSSIFSIYEKGEKDYAFYLAGFLPCFLQEYEEVTDEFWKICHSSKNFNKDYEFVLKFVKCMCCPLYLDIDSDFFAGELTSSLGKVLQSMKEEMSSNQVEHYLSQKIDWSVFFETIDIEKGIATDFIKSLKVVAYFNEIKLELSASTDPS